jgi:hypothetical protein
MARLRARGIKVHSSHWLNNIAFTFFCVTVTFYYILHINPYTSCESIFYIGKTSNWYINKNKLNF